MKNNAKQIISVFDTNIWISYFICNKSIALKELVLDNNIILLRSECLTEELQTVILRPKFLKYSTISTEKFIELYFSLTLNINIKPAFTKCADPKDNFLFDLAIQTNANYLVSGDKQVLETPAPSNLSLLTLSQFEKLLV